MHNFSVNAKGKRPETVIKDFFKENKDSNVIVYYTGHGDSTGAWHFTLHQSGEELVVTPENVAAWFKEQASGGLDSLSIISQSCYSGRWCQVAESFPGIFTTVLTSASPVQSSTCNSNGSEATRFWFDGGQLPVKSVQHLFSWKFTEASPNRVHYSFVAHCKIKTHMGLTPLGMYFYPETNKSATSFGKVNYATGQQKWGTRKKDDDFWSEWDGFYKAGFKVKCLTCNDTWLGFYMDKGFGKFQTMLKGRTDFIKATIDENWKKGYRITSVCPVFASDSWMVVMTKGGDCNFPPLDSAGLGLWRIRSEWDEVFKELDKNANDGMIVTCLAYSKTAKSYFLVMTHATSHKGQETRTAAEFPAEWISAQWKLDHAITTLMYDGTRWFVAMTKGVCSRNAYTNNRNIAGLDYVANV